VTLPLGWRLSKLGEVGQIVSGSTPDSSTPEYWGGDIPWITPRDLSGYEAQVIRGGARAITKAGYRSCSTRMVPAGSVVFTSRAPIGYVAIAGNSLCTNQGFKTVIPSADVVAEYLYWYLRFATPMIRAKASGTTFLEISARAFAEVPIPVPTVDEQRQIVAAIEGLVSHLEVGNSALNRLGKKLSSYEKSMNFAALSGKLASLAGDVPIASGVRKDREGGPVNGRAASLELGQFLALLPVAWPLAAIGEVVDTRLGKMLSEKTRPIQNIKPYLRNQNVQWGRFDLTNVSTLEIRDEESERYRLISGDLLVCEGGEIGRAAIWRAEIADCYYQKALHRLRPGVHVSAEYLLCLFQLYALKNFFKGYSTGTTIAHLPQEALRAIPIALPPLEEQARIVSAIDARASLARSLRSSATNSRARSQHLWWSILSAAFTGRLVSQVLTPDAAPMLAGSAS